MQTFAVGFRPIFFGLSFFLSCFGLHSALLNAFELGLFLKNHSFELIMRLMLMKFIN